MGACKSLVSKHPLYHRANPLPLADVRACKPFGRNLVRKFPLPPSNILYPPPPSPSYHFFSLYLCLFRYEKNAKPPKTAIPSVINVYISVFSFHHPSFPPPFPPSFPPFFPFLLLPSTARAFPPSEAPTPEVAPVKDAGREEKREEAGRPVPPVAAVGGEGCASRSSSAVASDDNWKA